MHTVAIRIFFFFFFLSTRSQWGGKMVRGVENGGDFFSPFAVVISTPLKAQSSHSERALNVRLTSLTPLLLCVCVCGSMCRQMDGTVRAHKTLTSHPTLWRPSTVSRAGQWEGSRADIYFHPILYRYKEINGFNIPCHNKSRSVPFWPSICPLATRKNPKNTIRG